MSAFNDQVKTQVRSLHLTNEGDTDGDYAGLKTLDEKDDSELQRELPPARDGFPR